MNIRLFKDVKTISEFFERITWDMIERIAALQLILFSIVPLIRSFSSELFKYFGLVNDIFSVFSVISLVMFFLYIGKSISEHRRFSSICIQNRITFVCFAVFMMMMLVSTFINGFTTYARIGQWYRNESLSTYFLYFLVFFASGVCIRTRKTKAVIMRIFVLCSVINALLALSEQGSHQIKSVFFQFNHYGYYLTMSILACAGCVVWEKSILWRILGGASFVLLTIALIINDTFGCYLAVLAGLIFIVICDKIVHGKFRKIPIVLLLSYGLITFLMSFKYNTILTNFMTLFLDLSNIAKNNEESAHAGTGRMKLWRLTIDRIREKPIFGYGVEGITDYLQENTGYNNRTHNEYLQYTAFFGIPAAISYVVGVFCVFLAGLKQKTKLNSEMLIALSAAFGYCVSAFFGNTMFYTAPYFFMFLGLGFSTSREDSALNK